MFRRSKVQTVILLMVVGVAMVMLSSCKDSSDVTLSPTGELIGSAGCKTYSSESSSKSDDNFATSSEDCLQYNYDGSSVLTLTHVNAGFNCCPGELMATVDIGTSTITINEGEAEQGCKCLCQFDVYYNIENLSPGTYTIVLTGMYVEDQEYLEVTVDLSEDTSGIVCLERDYYPWSSEE